MLMFIATVLGLIGMVFFGYGGLHGSGAHRELDQILAIASFAMTAAGILGIWGPRYDRKHHIATPAHA